MIGDAPRAARLWQARGSELLDCQVMTPHVEALGARLIPRNEFLARLEQAQARGVRLF